MAIQRPKRTARTAPRLNQIKATRHLRRPQTDKTQAVFQRMEKKVGFPLLSYWTSAGGSICQNDVMVMSHLLGARGRAKVIGLFLKSEGGNPEAALRLVHLLRQHYERIVLFAPFECASAATMVALGANEIHMGPTSYLTAVDTSLRHDLSPVDHRNYLVSVSQDEVMRILRLWKEQKTQGNPYPEVYKYLHPLVIGALDRCSSLSIRICQELLSFHLKDRRRALRIARELNSAYPSHSYPITGTEAVRLGLNIQTLDTEVEGMLRELNSHYSAMAQERRTDHDAQNYHSEEVCNIIERNGSQMYYRVSKDWHYRSEERRWVSMNDESNWFTSGKKNGRWQSDPFFIC